MREVVRESKKERERERSVAVPMSEVTGNDRETVVRVEHDIRVDEYVQVGLIMHGVHMSKGRDRD